MEVSFLATNGGPHPADKWAATAAAQIGKLIQVDEESISETAVAARKAKPRLEIAIADAIEPHFSAVMLGENDKVDSGEIKFRNDQIDVDEYLDDAVSAIVQAASGTMFEAHFNELPVREVILNILKTLFLDTANIARSWRFDAKGL